jgi:hypothetical protein
MKIDAELCLRLARVYSILALLDRSCYRRRHRSAMSKASGKTNATQALTKLLEKTSDWDKDERYMATNDLCTMLKNYYPEPLLLCISIFRW